MTDKKKTTMKDRLNALGKKTKTFVKVGAVAATLVAAGKAQAAGSPMRRGSVQQPQVEYHEEPTYQAPVYQEPTYEQPQQGYHSQTTSQRRTGCRDISPRGHFSSTDRPTFGRGSRGGVMQGIGAFGSGRAPIRSPAFGAGRTPTRGHFFGGRAPSRGSSFGGRAPTRGPVRPLRGGGHRRGPGGRGRGF